MNESDYVEHLLLKSLEQEKNHHRSPCNQQHQQNFSYHYNLHHQGQQHYQHQQFEHQYQHKYNRRRQSSYSHSHSQSQSQSHNYNYNHIHNNYTDEEQDDRLKNTTVSTVSLSTEEMDPFDEMDLFDGCDGGDDNSRSDFDDIDISVDIDIDIDIDAANTVADCDNDNDNYFLTPTRKKEQPPSSSVFLNLKSSNLKQDEKETTNNENKDDHTASNPLLGQEQHEIKLEPSSPSSISQKQSIAKINNNFNHKGKKKTKDNNEDKLFDSIVRVKFPTECDILCGQSRICSTHVGNKRFQAVLDTYTTRYDNATSKHEKMMTTKEIVACIHNNSGGRFLKLKNTDGMWEEI